MAYSSYGGFAFRNGEQVISRSDCIIKPGGDVFSTPGMWPGFVSQKGAEPVGPSGHVVLGDGPIYLTMYKQSHVELWRGMEELQMVGYTVNASPAGFYTIEVKGEKFQRPEGEYFRRRGDPLVLHVHDHIIEIHWVETDNYYVHAIMQQPDGVVWSGFSGYRVGAGWDDEGKTRSAVVYLQELIKEKV